MEHDRNYISGKDCIVLMNDDYEVMILEIEPRARIEKRDGPTENLTDM